MTDPVTLRVSELYAWKKRLVRKSKRIYPSQRARARRRHAECMAVLGSRNQTQLLRVADGLRSLPLVSAAGVRRIGDSFELSVYSQLGLVTNDERLAFIKQVRIKLMDLLLVEVEVEPLNLR